MGASSHNLHSSSAFLPRHTISEMVQFKSQVFIYCAILAVHAERWYSAAIDDQTETHIPFAKQYPLADKTNNVQDVSQKYMPLTLLELNNNPTKDNIVKSSTEPAPKQERAHYFQNAKRFQISPKNETTQASVSKATFKATVTNEINNVSTFKRIRPKRKIVRKRCPSRPRRKKQLDWNARTRFLEVFEVVEFDHEACVSSSGLEGTCLHEYDCESAGGAPMGTCADGYGTCCVTLLLCDSTSAVNMGWFTNPGFPLPSAERLSCTMSLNKVSPDIKQIRLDFKDFELLPPTDGTCEQDQFIVSGQNVNNIVPILCGINTGQHVYIEVSNVEGPISFSLQTVSSENRLFSIKVSQLSWADPLVAPSGCLQYYKGAHGYMESFNYRDASAITIARAPSHLNHLNYAMCIERSPDSCSMTYTNVGELQILNYDVDGLPVIPPGQAGVEIFNCPSDWLLIAAVRLCGSRLNDGSVMQDFAVDAPVTDISSGPVVVWFRSDGAYVGRGFKLQYQQNSCLTPLK